MKIFSQRLIALRKERDMTQADLAKAVNKTRSTISGYETEGKEPDYGLLCDLAKFFSVSVDYLLGVEDCRNHSDIVFINDSMNFEKHYKALPSPLRHKVAKMYDSFYLLLQRDMVNQNEARLDLYVELLSLLQSYRAQIRNTVDYSDEKVSDPITVSNLFALQNTLKNDVSALLDKLFQADVESAFLRSGRSIGSSKSDESK